MIVGFKRLF